ncbi:hypothetical protein C8J57DRAFT_1501708 [Mycena rebaudengoi]|nr:hypothetical protein C8J57DRAFT_1501708 [Mycena rebaudengoi]
MNTATQTPSPNDNDDHDELAAAKLWAVYISEAEKYDKTLVEGWKSDMNGLLIFAGLFSASLTAFIIESYKTLTPDQGAITIVLLKQISRQLDPRLNASSVEAVTSDPFIPSASSLVCNALWFFSLGLSLSCALIATLVDQWSRDFIQRTEMRPSPIIRARIFSYLYFGIQRFGMHTMVEFIPLLLHGSLLLFFAGLVAFLYPINQVVTIVAGTLLGLTSAIYTSLTVLPIFFSNSPYRTPLSNIAWSVLQQMQDLVSLGRRHLMDEETTIASVERTMVGKHQTMVQAMTSDAVHESGERDERDARAIAWTVRSLTDNDGIEPFVEALPDLILGTNGRAGLRAYHDMLNGLLDDPTIRLVPRIEDLLRSCNRGHLPPDILTHTRMSCIKALWAIAYFVASDGSERNSLPVFDRGLLLQFQFNSPAMTSGPEMSDLTPWGFGGSPFVITATRAQKLSWTAAASRERTYLTSAYSIAGWIRFLSMLSLIQNVNDQLKTTTVSDAPALLKEIPHRATELGFPNYSGILSNCILNDPIVAPLLILRNSREKFILSANIDLFTEYLNSCAALDQKPRAFETICSMICHPELRMAEPSVQQALMGTFTAIIRRHKVRLRPYTAVHHIDIIAGMMLQLIVQSPVLDAEFTYTVGLYVLSRAASPQALERCEPTKLIRILGQYLSRGPEKGTADVIFALHILALNHSSAGMFDEDILAAISAASYLPISHCAIAVVKVCILVDSEGLSPNQLDILLDRMDLPRFSSQPGAPFGVTERWKAAFFAVLVEFLEEYSSLPLLGEWGILRAPTRPRQRRRRVPSDGDGTRPTNDKISFRDGRVRDG